MLFKFIISFILTTFVMTAMAQKNDTIYLMNGDRVSGEFKKYESGEVFFKTDALFNIYVKADHIKTVYSGKYFEFRTQSGYRYYGSIIQSNVPGSIEIVLTDDTIAKPMWDIVQISPINRNVFQRIDGSIDFGLNYSQSIDVLQYNLQANATYRSSNYSTRINLSNILSESGDDELSRNNNLGINVTRYLPHKWFANIQIDVMQYTELNLEYRVQTGPAVGYDLVRTTPMRLYSMAGVLLNQEKSIEPSEETVNVEAMMAINYTWHRYRHPKVDITSDFKVYPSLSVGGRVRVDYNLSVKYEIITDVFVNVSCYLNYDNKPDGDGFSKNDYGVIASLGYIF